MQINNEKHTRTFQKYIVKLSTGTVPDWKVGTFATHNKFDPWLEVAAKSESQQYFI